MKTPNALICLPPDSVSMAIREGEYRVNLNTHIWSGLSSMIGREVQLDMTPQQAFELARTLTDYATRAEALNTLHK
jgi:hypothetical protein